MGGRSGHRRDNTPGQARLVTTRFVLRQLLFFFLAEVPHFSLIFKSPTFYRFAKAPSHTIVLVRREAQILSWGIRSASTWTCRKANCKDHLNSSRNASLDAFRSRAQASSQRSSGRYIAANGPRCLKDKLCTKDCTPNLDLNVLEATHSWPLRYNIPSVVMRSGVGYKIPKPLPLDSYGQAMTKRGTNYVTKPNLTLTFNQTYLNVRR